MAGNIQKYLQSNKDILSKSPPSAHLFSRCLLHMLLHTPFRKWCANKHVLDKGKAALRGVLLAAG